MANEPDRRIGWPVLVVLLCFLMGGAYLVFRAHENSLAVPDPSAPIPGVHVDDDGPDTYEHHTWSPDGGLGEPPPSAADPEGRDRVYDPQRWAMVRSFGAESIDAGLELPFAPVEVLAQITESSGAIPVEDDAICALRVLPSRSGGFDCVIRMLCDGHVLYPNESQTAGYTRCHISSNRVHRGDDDVHTAVDGDPIIHFDLGRHTATVEDRGDGVERFSITFRLRH